MTLSEAERSEAESKSPTKNARDSLMVNHELAFHFGHLFSGSIYATTLSTCTMRCS